MVWLNDRPARIAELPRSKFDPELFPHSAYVKIFVTFATKVLYFTFCNKMGAFACCQKELKGLQHHLSFHNSMVLLSSPCCWERSTRNVQIWGQQLPPRSLHGSMDPQQQSVLDIVLIKPMKLLKAGKVVGAESLQNAYRLLHPYYATHLEVELHSNHRGLLYPQTNFKISTWQKFPTEKVAKYCIFSTKSRAVLYDD